MARAYKRANTLTYKSLHHFATFLFKFFPLGIPRFRFLEKHIPNKTCFQTCFSQWFIAIHNSATTLFLRFYCTLVVWRLKPILSADLRVHLLLSDRLWLRNYRAVAGNHNFNSRFSVGFSALLWRSFKQRALKRRSLKTYTFTLC